MSVESPSTLHVLEKVAEQRLRRQATAEEILHSTWGEGNIPYSHSVEVEEPLVEELGMKRCRSFRADLHHKLRIIVRAVGTAKKAAPLLGVGEDRLSCWFHLKAWPGDESTFQRIDSIYEFAVEKLRVERARKHKKPKN